MKRVKIFTILVTFLLVIPLFTYSSAIAASYVSPWIALSSTQSGSPGGNFQVLGYSFPANTPVTVSLGKVGSQLQQVGSSTTDSNGSFTVSTTIPTDAVAGDTWTVHVTETVKGVNSTIVGLNFVIGQVSAYQSTTTSGYTANGSYGYGGMYSYTPSYGNYGYGGMYSYTPYYGGYGYGGPYYYTPPRNYNYREPARRYPRMTDHRGVRTLHSMP
jgi:hypothetical protein